MELSRARAGPLLLWVEEMLALTLLSSEGDVGSSQPGWPGELVGKKPGG